MSIYDNDLMTSIFAIQANYIALLIWIFTRSRKLFNLCHSTKKNTAGIVGTGNISYF